MSFLSTDFLHWMIGIVVIYWLLPQRLQMHFVALFTLFFLLLFSPVSALVLLGLLVVSYFTMQRWRNSVSVVLLVGLIITLLFLAYKYHLQQPPDMVVDVTLLLGASFYVLRVIHYIIESYKGSLARHSFTDYLHYMLFLPVIVVGPINRFDEFLRELRRRRRDGALFASGLERIVYGYVKVVLLAGYLVNQELHGYINALGADEVWLRSYLQCIEYGLNLYFMFSGYSDIAIGFARLLGIRIGENFHYPFIQPNISQFWKGWHISLSSWCRDYVYMPIAAHYRRPFVGIVASMLILGLWHELSARYVAWGIYHGLGIVAWQYFQGIKPRCLVSASGLKGHAVTAAATFITFNFVMFSFAITMSENLGAAMAVYRNLLLLGGGG